MPKWARSAFPSPTSATCAQLLDGIDVATMNTSMTINAPASWLLSLYIANATVQGVASGALSGTTQNDIVKEYLSRGTYIFPPGPSLRLIVDMIAFTVREVPRWNPINVCSYHLQEAGATPVQELAYAMATAIGVLDAVRDSGQVGADDFPAVVGRVSFFVNAGIRFVEEVCKLRAFASLWDRTCRRPLRRGGPGVAPLPLRGAGRTRSASPRRSRRTTSPASSSRCSA